jgi:uncharacterized protein YggE
VKNAAIVEELMKRLEKVGVSKEDVKTTSYNIYMESTRKPTVLALE